MPTTPPNEENRSYWNKRFFANWSDLAPVLGLDPANGTHRRAFAVGTLARPVDTFSDLAAAELEALVRRLDDIARQLDVNDQAEAVGF